MTRKFTFIILLLTGSSAFAQDSAMVSSLNEVVITASKYSRKQTETGKVLTVVSREQLERSSGKTLSEVLNTVAGTTIIGSNSNLGTNLAVSIRGATVGNVLILINGIPVNDPSVITNYFDLNFIDINQVERVEILKGGQSTLYGSDAVAGVINIIMRKPSDKDLHANVSASAGSYGTFKANAGISQASEKSQLSLQYGYLNSKGFSAAYDSTGNNNFDKDKYDQHNITGTWQIALTDKLSANLFGQYSRYKAGVDANAFKDEKDYTVTTDNIQGGAGLGYQLNNGALRFNYRYNNVKRLYLDDSVFNAPNYLRSDYAGRTHFVELYGNKKWKHVELLAGVDYRKNIMSLETISVSAWGPFTSELSDSLGKMDQVSPYASVVLKANKIFNIELGGRWNIHSEYGNNFTYTINPNAFISDKVKLFANFYSAFKTPTLYQLFDPFSGNTALQPEESFNAEGGAQWFINRNFNVRAVYFYRKTKDAIEYIYTDPSNYIAQYSNVNNKTAQGIELEAEYRGEKWNVSANYTHIRGRLSSGYDNTGFPIGKDTSVDNVFRNPNDVFNLNSGIWVTKKFYAGTTLRIAGKRLEPVYGGDPKQLDSYYTVDLYGEYRLLKKMKLFADFKNITNQRYFEILGYNARRFNMMAGIQLGL